MVLKKKETYCKRRTEKSWTLEYSQLWGESWHWEFYRRKNPDQKNWSEWQEGGKRQMSIKSWKPEKKGFGRAEAPKRGNMRVRDEYGGHE